MGAIPKPDGTVRPIHDGTHFVQVNNHIEIQDQLQYPGPHEAAGVIRETLDTRQACFCISADIEAAHRLVKVRERDHPLLACKANSSSKTLWVNKVGAFGISSAPFWWTRLFSIIGRMVSFLMLDSWCLQLVYVDDLHISVAGPEKFVWLWMILAAYEVLGTPFSYRKFKGGLSVEFVGFYLDYKEVTLGVITRRGEWLLNFIREMAQSKYTISMRRFAEFLGRLAFVARVVVWLKPFLSPLYSWSAVLDKGTVATAPKLVRLVLHFIGRQLERCEFRYTCRRPKKLLDERLRTDAKCEVGLVVLGGHEVSSGRWFSVDVRCSDMPCLFKSDGQCQWASGPAELLATLVGLKAFGYLDKKEGFDLVPVVLRAGTDNRANEALVSKASTTKWPLTLVNMQLAEHLLRSNLHLDLRWRPRDENTLADDLTNKKFENFCADKRVDVSLESVGVEFIQQLWQVRGEFLDKAAWEVRSDLSNKAAFEKSDW